MTLSEIHELILLKVKFVVSPYAIGVYESNLAMLSSPSYSPK
ncbi:227_t:CDS:2 [Rhizophagus irregularis]|nr:227_t:CDS:2 [Rhizophagus irregularis]